ncbi:MAG: short-chain fatty acid transporter [Bacteroidetes bacterium]|nr:short-chain fatty acid transporter [Bacteroidota bacterium]HET6243493.1 TIGR00366 family protein [Bacteroidia bacterium]
MNFSDRFARAFHKILPSPFAIALLLTFITFSLAGILTDDPLADNSRPYLVQLADYWYAGVWDSALMVFAMQMMLILVLGHVLALSKPVDKLINLLVKTCSNTAKTALIVCFFSLIVSFFNWGLGLVFGAIFARKIAEKALINGYKINYGLIGAAGYSGLMVWHGGLSGSAPIKVAEPGHFLEAKLGLISQSQTIFSTMNISVSLALLIFLPLLMYLLGKYAKDSKPEIELKPQTELLKHTISGAEKIDNSQLVSLVTGGLILTYILYLIFIPPETVSLSVITPNFINMSLLGLAIVFHQNFKSFLLAVDSAISGASGILIQFPLYFGIMGIMKYSGLTILMSDFFISISTTESFPVLTLLSAGIVNIFVPSGGGQWAVQGPIIAEAALKLNVLPAKAIMALAYGDQLTNMVQPFWALPLLGITGLKGKEILPYTLILMVVGAIIFITGLLLF